MKKTLSVMLAVLMLLATFTVGFAAFAEDTCEFCGKPHTSTEAGSCTCCLYCQYLDTTKVAGCAKYNGQVIVDENGRCCANCTGFFDCTCGTTNNCNCPYCSGTGVAPEKELEPIFSENTQEYIKNLFQQILGKIAEVFDRIFEVAFAVFNVK